MALTGGYERTITIRADALPLDVNIQIMAKFEIGDGNFEVDVEVDLITRLWK